LKETRAQAGATLDYSGTGAVFASIAAAVSSLAFFRIWGLFSMSLAGPGEMELSGEDLARELKGPIPWLYVTPAAILLVLIISAARLVDPSAGVRFAYSVLLPLVGSTLLVWPVDAVARITRQFSHMQSLGEGNMRLTWWWWTYCVSLVIVLGSGMIELASIFYNYMSNKAKGARVSR